jgi:LPXTG-motif cell wall-anchored protein
VAAAVPAAEAPRAAAAAPTAELPRTGVAAASLAASGLAGLLTGLIMRLFGRRRSGVAA